MTDDEGLSVREAVDWCGSGARTVREVTRLRQLAHDPPERQRPMSARRIRVGHSLSHPSGHPARRVVRGALRRAHPPCRWRDDTFTCRAATDTTPRRVSGSRTGDAHGMIRATHGRNPGWTRFRWASLSE